MAMNAQPCGSESISAEILPIHHGSGAGSDQRTALTLGHAAPDTATEEPPPKRRGTCTCSPQASPLRKAAVERSSGRAGSPEHQQAAANERSSAREGRFRRETKKINICGRPTPGDQKEAKKENQSEQKSKKKPGKRNRRAKKCGI